MTSTKENTVVQRGVCGPDNRVVRVFISSTFHDMMRERELLVKRVFPEIRRLCDERFVTFTEVDLRWGITEEQAAEGKCCPSVEEIYNCRPYFIGLLGERYGWIPHTVPPEIIDREPWLREHVHDGKSVTELEILHGVLNNPDMAEHTFFYLRDPAYVDREDLNEDDRAALVERDIPADIEQFGPEEAARRTQERRDRLEALKKRIRRSGFPVVDGYPSPKALAEAVEHQFHALIDQLYPEEQVPDPLDREALRQRAFAQRKLLAYVDRPTHTLAFDDFADTESSGLGLVVTGDSGVGKTALLAHWIGRYREQHPDHFVFEHYFGATSDSASVPRFLARLLGECKRLADIADDIPTAPRLMAEALPEWLARTATADGRLRLVLVLDALNQIEGDAWETNLSWWPSHLPPHVRVIASSLPGPALDTLRQRNRWSRLASGMLTGKYNAGIPADSRASLKGYEWLTPSITDPARLDKVRRLVPIAADLGVSLAQLSLAWCLKNPHVSTVITGASRVEQVRENMKALEVVPMLTPEVIGRMDAALEVQPAGDE